jgi:hypothetical protein
MGFLENLINQVNPWDKGKSWGNPTGAPQPAGLRRNLQNHPSMQAMELPVWKPGANPTPAAKGYSMPSQEVQTIIDKGNSMFQYTPAFKELLYRAQPTIETPEYGGLTNGVAGGTYSYGDKTMMPFNEYMNQESIKLSPKFADANVLTHEGLHSAFQTNPQTRKQFAQAYNEAVRQDPRLAEYANRRTGNYATKQGLGEFSDFNRLNRSMQTEAHSYLSEYPLYGGGFLPKPLENYYSQFFNVNAAPNRRREQNGVLRELHSLLGNGYRGAVGE